MSIALRMPHSSPEKSIPFKPNAVLIHEDELEDWLCEISNQLIGTVKAELLKHNCKIQIGIPISAAGSELQDIAPEGYGHVRYHFNVAHGCCESAVSLQFFEEKIDCLETDKIQLEEIVRSELEFF